MEEITNSVLSVNYALDTFYFLVMGALVMWMAAGFTMLESGLVRSKNTTEILTKNVGLFSIACIMYMLCGYSLMYPELANPDGDYTGGIFNSFSALSILGSGDNNLETVAAGDAYYSNLSDFFFQVVFVATAMSIVSGAVAERMKLGSFFIFAIFLTGLIYPIQGFWKWGGGFLNEGGFLDFAGSGVVHMTGAAAALAGVILLGPRKGKYGKDGAINPIPGANLPLAALGTLVLWLGWFGFNGGSQLQITGIDNANAVAAIFVNTNMAACGGLVAALLLAQLWFGKADLTMALNGALAGLVAITAEPLMPSPITATLIGAVGGLIVVCAIVMFDKIKIDDPVGAISVHGVVGIWGLLVVPFTQDYAALSEDKGVPWGLGDQMLWQIIGMATIFVWVFAISFAVWFALKLTVGIRVNEEDEYNGLDLAECGMEAYPEFASSES
ncbi:MAG: ammonium transporter [Pseudomonadota bacterium]